MKKKYKSQHVVMIGTNAPGGVATVVRAYRDAGLFKRWDIKFICTHQSVDSGFLEKLWAAVSALAQYLALLVCGRVKLLHIHTSSRASFWRKSVFVLLSRVSGKPVVMHIHSGEFIHFFQNECGAIAKWYIRAILSRADTIIVLTKRWRKELSRLTPHRNIAVILNPIVAPGETLPFATRATNSLLYLGRITGSKGIFDILAVMAALKDEFVDLQLICAGEGDIAEAKTAVSKLLIVDHVKFHGWIEDDEKQRLLSHATAMVLPSYAEGLPMSVLEAMAAGLPVVATNVGGIPDVIKNDDTGLLVAPGDKTQLVEALQRILSSGSLRQRLSTNAQKVYLREFEVDAVLRQVSSVYRRTLASGT